MVCEIAWEKTDLPKESGQAAKKATCPKKVDRPQKRSTTCPKKVDKLRPKRTITFSNCSAQGYVPHSQTRAAPPAEGDVQVDLPHKALPQNCIPHCWYPKSTSQVPIPSSGLASCKALCLSCTMYDRDDRTPHGVTSISACHHHDDGNPRPYRGGVPGR